MDWGHTCNNHTTNNLPARLILWPCPVGHTCLYLAKMGLMEQHHAKTALPNAAAYAQRQLAGQQFFVEIKLFAALLSCNLQLPQQCLLVYTYAHRRKLYGTVKRRIPYQDVTVKTVAAVAVRCSPVVIVGRAAVVRFAV